MKTYRCFLDESGAKGRADIEENELGEFGLMVGILISAVDEEKLKQQIETLLCDFKHDGKFHITDLSADEQERLRNIVFDWVSMQNIPCFYDAQYVKGFHEAGTQSQNLIESGRKASSSRFVNSSNIPQYERLHKFLFQGTALKTICYLKDTIGIDFTVDYFVDRVDKAILIEFRKSLTEEIDLLLNNGQPTTSSSTYFDKDTKSICKKTITKTVEGMPENWHISSHQIGMIEIAEDGCPLIVVSDVISNSLNHHIKSFLSKNMYACLDSHAVLKDFPIAHFFEGVSPVNKPTGINANFRHPENKPDKSQD